MNKRCATRSVSKYPVVRSRIAIRTDGVRQLGVCQLGVPTIFYVWVNVTSNFCICGHGPKWSVAEAQHVVTLPPTSCLALTL